MVKKDAHTWRNSSLAKILGEQPSLALLPGVHCTVHTITNCTPLWRSCFWSSSDYVLRTVVHKLLFKIPAALKFYWNVFTTEEIGTVDRVNNATHWKEWRFFFCCCKCIIDKPMLPIVYVCKSPKINLSLALLYLSLIISLVLDAFDGMSTLHLPVRFTTGDVDLEKVFRILYVATNGESMLMKSFVKSECLTVIW